MSAWPRVVVVAALGALSEGPALAQNLVSNGSFEATSVFAGSGWTRSGFSTEGFDFFIDTDAAHAHSGSHSFAGGAVGGMGFIGQNLATTAGTTYDVSLWLGNLSGFAENTAVQVRWNGQVVYEVSGILGFSYQQIHLSQVAAGSSTALSIGLRDDSFFLSLDDVSVTAVPEPSAAALLVLGIGALAWRRRASR